MDVEEKIKILGALLERYGKDKFLTSNLIVNSCDILAGELENDSSKKHLLLNNEHQDLIDLLWSKELKESIVFFKEDVSSVRS